MQIVIPTILNAQTINQVLDLLRSAPPGEGWIDGKVTTGPQSRLVKNNEQMPEQGQVTAQARDIVVSELSKQASFVTAALPRRVYPPSFNRYKGASNAFGSHIDNALRNIPRTPGFLRTDISCTLFLSDPASYDGGELVVSQPGGEQAYKLPAGSALLYPATTVHRVNPVTRGERIACFFWVESMVRSAEQRQLLYELDMTIMAQRTRELEATGLESVESVRLTGTYHNLLRMWAET